MSVTWTETPFADHSGSSWAAPEFPGYRIEHVHGESFYTVRNTFGLMERADKFADAARIVSEDADNGRYLVIEHDNMTGWEKRLDNYALKPWGDTFSRREAEESVEWRKAKISGRYSYVIRPVTVWVLDITTGTHHHLFMKALETGLREEDPYEPPTVRVKPDGEPGGYVFAYTRKGVSSPPDWLIKLCEFFENDGQQAGIRRP